MTPDISKQILFQMKRIRVIEEEIARRYPEGKCAVRRIYPSAKKTVAAAVGLT